MNIRRSEYQKEKSRNSENQKKQRISDLCLSCFCLSLSAFLFLMFSAASASQVFDPTDIGVGARPLGMGKAFTAIANDGSALFTNPAGLALSNRLNVMSMSGSLMTEVPYTVFGGSYPIMNGVLGIGYIGVGVNGIKEARLNGITPEVTGVEGAFANTTLAVSYATDIQREFSIFKDNKLGMTVKLISQGYTGSASFEKGNGSAFDVDFGMISTIDKDTKAGLTVKNLIPGNNSGNDELAMVIGGGVSRVYSQYNLTTALDAELNRTLLFHAGLEWAPITMLRLRAGLDQKPSAGASVTNLAAGLGLAFRGFTFDYAYHTFAELSEGTTHFFSIGYLGEERVKAVVPPLDAKRPL
jgi:hypothetical protein